MTAKTFMVASTITSSTGVEVNVTIDIPAASALNDSEVGLPPRDLDDWIAVASAKDGAE